MGVFNLIHSAPPSAQSLLCSALLSSDSISSICCEIKLANAPFKLSISQHIEAQLVAQVIH